MPIDTPQALRAHLELAIQIELATVPAYLYAMYSLEDHDAEPALLLRSIVAEEMLHAALAANLLIAVGGEPKFADTDWIPRYPMLVPHHAPPLEVALGPASDRIIRDVFMRIEQPEVHGAPAQPDEFETLGQFYHAIELAIGDLDESFVLFADPRVERQMADPSFYAPVAFDADDSGGLAPVRDVASARDVIEVIVHQGEGLSTERWADPAHQELTHYFKLLRIADGHAPLGEVRPVPTNPSVADYPDDIRAVADLFNALYRYSFLVLDEIFSGSPSQGELVGRLYGVMVGAMGVVGRFLVDHRLADGTNAAPTFEVYEFVSSDPVAELAAMANAVAERWPELSPVVDVVAPGD